MIRHLAWLLLAACSIDGGTGFDGNWENLAPVTAATAGEAQPLRAHPFAVAMTSDGRTALVTLRGSEREPGDQVVFIDVAARRAGDRVTVGARPAAIALRPQGDFAVVLSWYSPFAAVISLASHRLVGTLRLGYYAADLVFDDSGERMWVSNRADDQVSEWRVTALSGGLSATLVASQPAGTNPGALALSGDGSALYVADAGGLGVRVYDTADLTERGFIPLNAPVFDLAAMGPWVVAATLNDTNGLPCDRDSDFPGVQGDGIYGLITDSTCSRGFADVQNELAFIDPGSDQVAIRYTSDSAEISEADREGDHDPALMQVRGSLPASIAVVRPTRAYLAMSASFELVEVAIDGSAPPQLTMPRAWDTGFAPQSVAVDGEGTVAVTANKLGDSVTIIDLASGERSDVGLGPSGSPPFPATEAELGELFFNTSRYATDGDISCTHCHPDGENDGKAWDVDVVRAYGRRAVMPMRYLADGKPLLIEGVFDELDFNLEMEGISFRPDFHDSSYTLQVERRDQFYRDRSRELFGREVGFTEMVRAVGAFLVVEPRGLPSPFADDTPAAERGRSLFLRPDVGCAACHPPPTFASEENFAGVTTLGRYDRPRRDLDPNVSIKFIENARDGFFNANTLRGLWDRRGALFHDGRARTIREALLTPGHRCLHEGERAFNEFDGQVDTNGGISQLSCDQIDDLVAYLVTLD